MPVWYSFSAAYNPGIAVTGTSRNKLGFILDSSIRHDRRDVPTRKNGIQGQVEIVHARFLDPLVKARGFGMTSLKRRVKVTH